MPIHQDISEETRQALERKRWRHNIDTSTISMRLVTKPDPRNNLDHGHGGQQREHYPDITAPEYRGTCSVCGPNTLIEKSGTYKRAARDKGTIREEVDIYRCPVHVQNVRDLNAMRRSGWTIPALRKGRVADSEKSKPLFLMEQVVPPVEFGVPATEDTDPDALTQLDVVEEYLFDQEQENHLACAVCAFPGAGHILVDTDDGVVYAGVWCDTCFRIGHLMLSSGQVLRAWNAGPLPVEPDRELTHAFAEAVQPRTKTEREQLSRIVGKPRFYRAQGESDA